MRAWAFETMDWHKYFTYDAETGNLIWKVRDRAAWNTRYAGKVAGVASFYKGGPRHVAVSVRCATGGVFRAHRIIWEMHNGPIPDGIQIDHRDGNPLNNRLTNLRLATPSQNSRNMRMHQDNTSGMKGVSWEAGRFKWKAQIMVNRKNTLIGRFATKEQAHEAYSEAAAKYHGEFARTK